MIWVALFTAIAVAVLDRHALRRSCRREVGVYGSLMIATLAMSALVSWHLWPNLHLLAPFDAMFGPVTKWIYGIL
ncbi:MAG: hypothetical protein K6T63_09260 [Alicyclobacillus herbarius]|uniref:hypothetical protein n=1 Tax=Alicyclobacillus herbarius TaxID=122960 RepID=UPI00047BE293|nr:hypothetical protein [Alicyclobacillus herbarius]MCL6632809.1 hypothetical protein [Alicyclobacillus herbarius]